MLIYNKVISLVCLLLQLCSYIKAQGPPVFASAQSLAAGSVVKTNVDRSGLREWLQLAPGAEKFALEFLKQVSDVHATVPNRSYMISPFSVWSLLLLLTEGAEGNTLNQLRNTLRVGNNQNAIRSAYHLITKYLTVNTTTIEVASFNALFTNINTPVSRDYENIIERDYNSALIPVDFNDVNNTFTKINRDIREATRGLIPYTVTPQDFQNANILMVSSLYFKGKWKFPFEPSKTISWPFKDEDGKVLGNVPMMLQTGPFNFTYMKELEGTVLELPYGKENRLSMLIILPKLGVKLNKVVNNLVNVGLRKIHQQLQAKADWYGQSDSVDLVDVFIPKFTTESHFTLSPILKNMGILDLFNAGTANLNNIARDNYVSSIFHATRIIVNEEGTEAAAATVAVLEDKIGPSQFIAERPFAYVIVEKTANVLLFAGEIRSNV